MPAILYEDIEVALIIFIVVEKEGRRPTWAFACIACGDGTREGAREGSGNHSQDAEHEGLRALCTVGCVRCHGARLQPGSVLEGMFRRTNEAGQHDSAAPGATEGLQTTKNHDQCGSIPYLCVVTERVLQMHWGYCMAYFQLIS